MDEQLAAIRDALDKTLGRDLDRARTLASAYVNTHPDVFAQMDDFSRDECVTALTAHRAAGREVEQWQVEAWLLHQFEPMQTVGGINWQAPVEELA